MPQTQGSLGLVLPPLLIPCHEPSNIARSITVDSNQSVKGGNRVGSDRWTGGGSRRSDHNAFKKFLTLSKIPFNAGPLIHFQARLVKTLVPVGWLSQFVCVTLVPPRRCSRTYCTRPSWFYLIQSFPRPRSSFITLFNPHLPIPMQLSFSSPSRWHTMCILFIVIVVVLLTANLVTGSPIPVDVSFRYDVRTGYYRKSIVDIELGHDETQGWVRPTSRLLTDIKFICIRMDCLGRLMDEQVLLINKLKIRESLPDRNYFKTQKDLTVNWENLEQWHHDKFATLWDFLKNISETQNAIKEKTGTDIEVYNDDTYIHLIISYLIMENIVT
ncbi:hypothetical protein F5877DRAFT_83160 [Lentinula edodes]|nr:hypothetical protein F5877DRAFT_83160 [Lentinula edodes]